MAENNEKVQGTVAWFNSDKGFGFLEVTGMRQQVFVHYSAIQTRTNGRRNLLEGDKVEFEIEQAPKGPQAKNVVILF